MAKIQDVVAARPELDELDADLIKTTLKLQSKKFPTKQEIADTLGISKSTISRRFLCYKAQGLMEVQRLGSKVWFFDFSSLIALVEDAEIPATYETVREMKNRVPLKSTREEWETIKIPIGDVPEGVRDLTFCDSSKSIKVKFEQVDGKCTACIEIPKEKLVPENSIENREVLNFDEAGNSIVTDDESGYSRGDSHGYSHSIFPDNSNNKKEDSNSINIYAYTYKHKKFYSLNPLSNFLKPMVCNVIYTASTGMTPHTDRPSARKDDSMASIVGPPGIVMETVSSILNKPQKLKRAKMKPKKPDHRRATFEKREPEEYTYVDMRIIFEDEWKKTGWKGFPEPWTRKEERCVAKMIRAQGGGAIAKAFRYFISEWDHISDCLGLQGYPSVACLYGYRRTLVFEALNGKGKLKSRKRPQAEWEDSHEQEWKEIFG